MTNKPIGTPNFRGGIMIEGIQDVRRVIDLVDDVQDLYRLSEYARARAQKIVAEEQEASS